MSAPDIDEFTLYLGETAVNHMCDGLAFMQGLVELNDLAHLSAAQAILIAGYALVRQRETHYEERRREWLGSQEFSEPSNLVDMQRARDYNWLKSMVERACPDMGEEEHREAMARIARLAGV